MTSGFVGTITADGEVGMMGERGEEIERSPVFGSGHLGAILLHEPGPVSIGLRILRQFYRFGIGRKRR